VKGATGTTESATITLTNPSTVVVYAQGDSALAMFLTDNNGYLWTLRWHDAATGQWEFWTYNPSSSVTETVTMHWTGIDHVHMTLSAWDNVNPTNPFSVTAPCVDTTASATSQTCSVMTRPGDLVLANSQGDWTVSPTITPTGGLIALAATHIDGANSDFHATAFGLSSSGGTVNDGFTSSTTITGFMMLTDVLTGGSPQGMDILVYTFFAVIGFVALIGRWKRLGGIGRLICFFGVLFDLVWLAFLYKVQAEGVTFTSLNSNFTIPMTGTLFGLPNLPEAALLPIILILVDAIATVAP